MNDRVCQHGIGRIGFREPAFDLPPPLFFELADETLRRNDIGMLIGVPAQQLVELPLELGDARVELRYRDRALRRRHRAMLGLFLQLLANAVAGLLGDAKLDAGIVHLLGQRPHLAEVGLRAVAEITHILEPKRLHASLGFTQFVLVVLDLFVEELARAVGSDAGLAQALFDEGRKRSLNHVAGFAAIDVAKRDGVDVVAAGARNRQRTGGFIDKLRCALSCGRIQIGLADDLLEVRACE